MENNHKVYGTNDAAAFALTIYRGEGMALLAMNWKDDKPPLDFVGFAIEYMEPNGAKFYPLKNRLTFEFNKDSKDKDKFSTIKSPIQKFRWVHFPYRPDIDGFFTYKVTPVFMSKDFALSFGEFQTAQIALATETYPNKLNVTFTRGFVSSQSFVDKFAKDGKLNEIVCPLAKNGLEFKPSHTNAENALKWMGFEAYREILKILDKAIADDSAQVQVIAYDLNQPEILDRLKKLSGRVKVIIDESGDHGKADSAETKAFKLLKSEIGEDNVIRQKMGNLQHNKIIVVNGENIKSVVCGSTNFSWRGFFVQNNNALILHGEKPVEIFSQAFENYWKSNNKVKNFGSTDSATWNNLELNALDISVSFSPHIKENELLRYVADDISVNATSSVLYSLAFLYEAPGAVHDAVKNITENNDLFVYGISDKKDNSILVKKPDIINPEPVYSKNLQGKKLPNPFKPEPGTGGGTSMHHKFIVVDFDKPTGRVYLGSYNFSNPADLKNGENLLLIKDSKIVTSYMIEAVRIFDHYEFRVKVYESKSLRKSLSLALPPSNSEEKPWWDKYWSDERNEKDRIIFSS